ncbi:helix-turn-helix domain-containing protein [Lentzea sp. DG1S-22]|uniref:helix-turn-helix domain-containing protein n=1 Tax=Lentzea sp. DG1S-22 TaxID=3108822 RepID=UPI002E76C981|nr:helix-turn-helix domain-containing protein [Lentzea sp. DG1S-22]WVH84391.1 helix-turn-helix domain-containing protein [Lentzea sp. DG1S-22]
MTNAEIITLNKYLYKIPEAMTLLSLSRSVIYEQIRAGRLRFVKQGRATLVPASAIRDYVALLEQEAEVHYGESA